MRVRIELLLRTIKVKASVKHMYRLDEKKKLVNRPLKIVLESEEERNLVLKNLYKLKGAEDWHFKVRISRDLTKEERKAIKRLSDIAKEEMKKNNQMLFDASETLFQEEFI